MGWPVWPMHGEDQSVSGTNRSSTADGLWLGPMGMLTRYLMPVEQGRLARPAIPQHLRRCTLCKPRALGDERHFILDHPHTAHIRRPSCSLYQDADGAMQCLVWHKDQKVVCHCLAAILSLANDSQPRCVLMSQCWLNGLMNFSSLLSLLCRCQGYWRDLQCNACQCVACIRGVNGMQSRPSPVVCRTRLWQWLTA